MFYPFTAPMACAASKTSVDETKFETEILIKAYAEIAHVWINRAAKKGCFRTTIYVPYETRRLLDDLKESGFEIKHLEKNYYSIHWGDGAII